MRLMSIKVKASTRTTIIAYLGSRHRREVNNSLMTSLLDVPGTEDLFCFFFLTVKASSTQPQSEREKCPEALPLGYKSLLERGKLCFHK